MTTRYRLLFAALILSAASSSWAYTSDSEDENNNNNSKRVQVSEKEEEEIATKPISLINDTALSEEVAYNILTTLSEHDANQVMDLSEKTSLPLMELLRKVPHWKKEEQNYVWDWMLNKQLPEGYSPIGKTAHQILADRNHYASVTKGRPTLSTLKTETPEDASKIILGALGNLLQKKYKK